MRQTPIRKLRRDRSRLVQELSMAKGSGDGAVAAAAEARIRELDREIAALEADAARKG
jgi:hypothetical protein